MSQKIQIFSQFDDGVLSNVEDVNSSFAKGTLKVMYVGDNRNGTHISKESVEKALPSIKNVPIVCHWKAEEKEIGGHDMGIVSDEDGIRIVNLTVPCGVVPEHATAKFVVEADESGTEHEYLVLDDVLLWKRQDVYSYIVNELKGNINHSMEINVSDGAVDDDGIYQINNFEFTALCLLGEGVEPCFEGSKLSLFSLSPEFEKEVFMTKVQEMVADIQKMYEEEKASPEETNEQKAYDLTREKLVKARKAVSNITETDGDGNVYPYWFEDFDEEKGEIYAISSVDELLYGFKYEADDNGEYIIHKDTGVRKKYAIVDAGENDNSPYTEGIRTAMDENMKASADAAASEYILKIDKLEKTVTELKATITDTEQTISSLKSEMEAKDAAIRELTEYKAGVEADKAKEERNAVLADFADLEGLEEFSELREKCLDYDPDTLRMMCYAIRGKNTKVVFTRANNNAHKIIIDKSTNKEETEAPYGGVVEHYLGKN